MAAFALVPHRHRAEACDMASAAAEWLAGRGHDVRVPADDAQGVRGAEIVAPDRVADGLDLAIALGGDGTMIHAVQLVCGSGVPVLGVNIGRLGFLTTVEPAHLFDSLERFLAGDYAIQERMMLDVTVRCNADDGVHAVALNEAVLEKIASGHTVHLAIRINDRPFTTAAADGMIVATPTGSTAYNLSARGPIVSPRHRAILITPVAPHMLFDRPLVLDPQESVELEVLDGRPATLVVDGRELGTLAPGDRVCFRAAKHAARFVTFDERDFHQILKAKFKLADR
jgi:NAD+ kinase